MSALIAAEEATTPVEGVPPPAKDGPVAGTDWARYFDDADTPYYVHNASQETVWDAPPDVVAALKKKLQ